MRLEVQALDSDADAQAVGLTEERIQLAVESRLRAARLYTESEKKANFAHIYIAISVIGPAFTIHMGYRKWVTDLANNSNGRATTWAAIYTGTHVGDADFIIQSLSSLLDRFLAGYPRVNESACDTR